MARDLEGRTSLDLSFLCLERIFLAGAAPIFYIQRIFYSKRPHSSSPLYTEHSANPFGLRTVPWEKQRHIFFLSY